MPSSAERENQVPVFQFRKNSCNTKKNSLDHFSADVGGHGDCLCLGPGDSGLFKAFFLVDVCQQLRRCRAAGGGLGGSHNQYCSFVAVQSWGCPQQTPIFLLGHPDVETISILPVKFILGFSAKKYSTSWATERLRSNFLRILQCHKRA